MVNSAAGDEFHDDAPDNQEGQRQTKEKDASYQLADVLIVACILVLGAFAFFSRDRAGDFLYDDVYYADCAKSLLARGFYGILDRPETTQPPGVSAILALLCFAGACTRAVFLSAMAVFETLGFLACYALLRRQTPRVVAGAICLLLMSSSLYFSLATQWVSTCFPFLFATMGSLLVARRLEAATRRASQYAWGFLLSVLLAASLMFGSTAIALVGSFVMWIAISMLRERALGVMRLRKFLAVLLIAIAVEGIWMSRKPFDEWPRVPGFPGPYTQQLLLKDGHDPELGRATLNDIPARIGRKAFEQSLMLAEVVFRRWIDPSWASMLIMGPLLLIFAGWFYSVWNTGGGLEEWYFAAGEFILFLWPWRLDPRSFLPLAPLACLFAWRGAFGLVFFAKHKARLMGAIWLPMAAILSYSSWRWMHGVAFSGPTSHAGLQAESSFAVWILSGLLATWMIWKDCAWTDSFIAPGKRFSSLMERLPISTRTVGQFLVGAIVASLIFFGISEQWSMRRGNLDLTSPQHRPPTDLEAALWVRDHTDSSAVIMARQVPITYHYSGRNMVWFPPSANAQILMEGIRRYKVNYVVLIRRKQSYFLPPEEDCFAAVLADNPGAFRLASENTKFRVYETETPAKR